VAGKGALLVDPKDEAGMAKGLFRLAKGPRSPWAAKGRRELKRFSWKKAAEETLRLYHEAAETRGATL
jgi:glycosyltransferase involved in cell wall biosynthesis